MDDLKMVREAYGRIAPDDGLRARVRARLAAETGVTAETAGSRVSGGPGGHGRGGDEHGRGGRGRGGNGRGGRDWADVPVLRVRGWRRGTVPVGLAAAAAIAAVAITITGSGSGDGPVTVPAPPVALSTASGQPTARTILLAAARTAAAEPEGRFWRLHTVGGSTGTVEGPASYTILAPSEFDGWRSPSAGDTDVTFQRDLPAHPLTDRDKAAWESAGSPSSFKVRNNEDFVTYTTGEGDWRQEKASPEDKRQAARSLKELCARPEAAPKCSPATLLNWQDKERIAADPGRFQELLFPRAAGQEAGPAAKLQQGFVFLIDQPASPKVRAEAFRVLADLPGVRSRQDVTTSDGRAGIGIAADGKMIDESDAAFEYMIIFDPETHTVIGEKQTITAGTYRGLGAGTLLMQTSVKQAGWTSEDPHHD
ncbi:CU044_5270 family protein [Sphaerisporangium corydalis]|uniref:CU044_5270 family protein n=1 Tax=Sphaerisporangium corydalis TaxID=1441875 RepID=A0ABV9ELR7_9ACTN|nr:CU044_5270 family protein [Sphaerisporangium corydalis]